MPRTIAVTTTHKMWLELGGLLVGALMMLRFMCLPLLSQLAHQQARLRAMTVEIEGGAALIAQADASNALLAQTQQRHQALAQRFGQESSLARVLETLKVQAQDHRVELVAMQPKASDAKPRTVTLGEGMQLREVPLIVHVTGRYRHIGEFIARLADEPFAVAVRSLKMVKAEGSRTRLRAELLMTVYLTEAK